jgi:tRNA A-37 threonylcarbamoyl transferase component Bud32
MKLGRRLGLGRTSEVFEIDSEGCARRPCGGSAPVGRCDRLQMQPEPHGAPDLITSSEEPSSDKIVKLYFNTVPESAIARDYQNSRHAAELGLPSPAVYDRATIDERRGIILERITGDSLIGAIFQNQVALHDAAHNFAEIHWRINSTDAPGFRPLAEALKEALAGIPAGTLSEAQRAALFSYIEGLPEGTAACHLDFHPDNVLYAGGRCVVIDWALAAKGPAMMDFAFTSLIIELGELPPGLSDEMQQQVTQLRKQFVDTYQATYLTAAGASLDEAAPWRLAALTFRLGNWGLESERDMLISGIRKELENLGC